MSFGSSVVFIDAFATVPLESRLCWDDNRFDDVTIHADQPIDTECNRPEVKYDMRINIKESRWRRREFLELGATTTAMAATVDDAKAVAASGVDAVVAQGGEAGGHRSTWVKRESRDQANIGGMALIPQIVDAVRVPVIAAGGITDGRGIAAALALGASGALIGTRFIATRESGAPDFYKQALLKADSDATTVTDKFTGMYARVLRNAFTEEYESSGAPAFPPFFQFLAMGAIIKAATERGSGEYFPMYAGQGVGSLRDLPRAADVVHSLVREAQAVITCLLQRARSI